MRSGNALQVWVKTNPNVGNAKVNLTVNSINGANLNRTIQTAGNNLYSFDAATFEGQNLNAGFTLTGTVTLTFTGTIPYGSRLNFAVTAGNTTCTTQQQSQLGYVYSDHLDTPRLITNGQGQALWAWDSDAFGTTNANENPSNLGQFNFNLRFPGQYYDKETKTHYNYFRDYDPSTGRYLQSDPIGLEGGTNTYGHVNGNPVSSIDPYGLFTVLLAPGTSFKTMTERMAFNKNYLDPLIRFGKDFQAKLNRSCVKDRQRRGCPRFCVFQFS